MNIVEVKQPSKRFETNDVSNLSIKAYGKDNYYPQRILETIANSASGTLCARRMARFVEGRGFTDKNLYGYVINSSGQTMDDLLKLVTKDYSYLGGFALHVNYNALMQIVEVRHIPFENCRIGVEDEQGYISKIAIHPDWSGQSKRAGKQLKVSANTVDYVDVFNPLHEVVQAQIEAVGSIEQYKGQVLYCSGAGNLTYPTPMCDTVITEMSTEEGLANVSYRNTRHHFSASGMLIRHRNTMYNEDEQRLEDEQFNEMFAGFQGDSVAGKIIGVTIEGDEIAPEFKSFESKNFDKEFTATENRTVEKIYAAFEQEKFYRIRSGSLYFSSSIAATVNNDYSEILITDRQFIERVFVKVFKYWHSYVSDDFTIIPILVEVIKENEDPNQSK